MRIACLLANGFEDTEFRVPFSRFVHAGHEVIIVGLNAGEKVRGKQGKEEVLVQTGLDRARPEDFDALFIPGGYSPGELRKDDKAVAFTRAFKNKPIFAICHGPQLLLTAGLVAGRTMTSWKSVQDEIAQGGAKVVDREVVVDGNFVTSRNPGDIDAFTRESLKQLSRAVQPELPRA